MAPCLYSRMVVHYPDAFTAYVVYGYVYYMNDRKHRIQMAVKPSEAMRAIARREMDLKREKEKILLEESG